jgi:hypothetical protein
MHPNIKLGWKCPITKNNLAFYMSSKMYSTSPALGPSDNNRWCCGAQGSQGFGLYLQGILKGGVSLYRWPPVWFGISCMTTNNFYFYLQNWLIQTSQTGGQRYRDTSLFSIPCKYNPRLWAVHAFCITVQGRLSTAFLLIKTSRFV